MAHDHKWVYKERNMNFDKDLGLKGKYCYHPFNTITVDGDGDVYICICQAWLPIPVGNILDFSSFDDISNSIKAKQIQSTIIDGSYRYCDNNTCSIIQENNFDTTTDQLNNTVRWINFALDPSCNLTCPSCRTEFIFLNEGPAFDKRLKIIEKLIDLIESHCGPLTFTLSGDGDPFASLIYRKFLSELNVSGKDVEIEIVTNGLLAKAHWKHMAGVHRNVVRFKMSFDAGSENVYNLVRRGGDWNKLIASAKYMVDWKHKHNSNIILTANFVVQKLNYKDMVKYVELCELLGFDEINFQKIVDWGTYVNVINRFDAEAIWKGTHPEYADFLKMLQHPSLNNNKVNLTNLLDLKNETK